MIDHLRWLHISDFHFRAHGDQFSQEVATQALLDDVVNRVGKGRVSLDFVLVSGDIAFSGKPSEYQGASAFLATLASRVGVMQERFFFVPGNHDVDRTKHRLAYSGGRHSLISEQEVDRVLGSPEDLAPLLDRQAAYRAFVDAFAGSQGCSWTADGLAYVAPIDVGGLRLCIVGLNSAWLSGAEAEEMKLVIGERQVIGALQIADTLNPQVLIAMAHHPIGWLQEWDQTTCHHRLLREAHFFHRGHLHQAEIVLTSTPDRPCLSIAAGSGHATRFYPNSYNLLDLDLGDSSCSACSVRYDPGLARFETEPVMKGPVLLQGSLPGTPDELSAALASGVRSASRYAPYLSALIRGDKTEIPVLANDAVEFRSPQIAQVFAEKELIAAHEFLKLRNLLRLYDDDISLEDRLKDHAAAVENFVEYLSAMAAHDAQCDERMSRGDVSLADSSEASHLPHTRNFLHDLRTRGDWDPLEVQARRAVNSSDGALARFAKAALAEALMHSEETAKREEAARISNELVTDPDASVDDYLLAAGCNEVLGEISSAVGLTVKAISKWGGHADLNTYARALAIRAGDPSLRAALESATHEGGDT